MAAYCDRRSDLEPTPSQCGRSARLEAWRGVATALCAAPCERLPKIARRRASKGNVMFGATPTEVRLAALSLVLLGLALLAYSTLRLGLWPILALLGS